MHQEQWKRTESDDFLTLSQTLAPSLGPWSHTNAYDQWGNRFVTGQPGLWPLTTQTPQSSAWFDTSNNRIASWSYDGAGNLQAAGVNTLTYDEESQITSRANASLGQTTQYEYDAEGRRVKKTELLNGQVQSTTVFVYDAQGPHAIHEV